MSTTAGTTARLSSIPRASHRASTSSPAMSNTMAGDGDGPTGFPFDVSYLGVKVGFDLAQRRSRQAVRR